MRPFLLHTRYEWFASLVVSSVAAVAVLGAAALLFVEDGRTPWFQPESRLAGEAGLCERLHSSTERHACLRAVAKTSADLPVAVGDAVQP